MYFIVGKGIFTTTYFYENSSGEHQLGPTAFSCLNTTCSVQQTGYPGSGGFSMSWEVYGPNASIFDISSHY